MKKSILRLREISLLDIRHTQKDVPKHQCIILKICFFIKQQIIYVPIQFTLDLQRKYISPHKDYEMRNEIMTMQNKLPRSFSSITTNHTLLSVQNEHPPKVL